MTGAPASANGAAPDSSYAKYPDIGIVREAGNLHLQRPVEGHFRGIDMLDDRLE
jgi:hypothetical protein